MVSGTCCPYVSVCGYEVVSGAAAPRGPMTYAFTHIGNFLPLAIEIWALGLDLGLEAGI